jgi:hypothetical protein
MNWIKVVIYTVVVVVFIPLQSAHAQSSSDTVAAITKLENDSVKADLAADTSWTEKFLADDWMGCDSEGKWYTKAEALKLMADTKNNNFKSEKLTDLKVRLWQHCGRHVQGHIRCHGRRATPRTLRR